MYTVNLKRFDNTDKVTIWDYRRDDNIMKSGTLDKSVDQIDEFKFELINDSRQFESFLTLVEIKNELKNNIVFRGRILIPSQHMAEDGIFNSDYTVEGAAAYMHDSYPSYKFFESSTPKSYITFLVNEHNKQVESYKQIKLGAVNFTMKEQVSEAVEYDTTKYAFTYLEKTVWQHIIDDCIGRWGGEILVRYEADGTYIDWLDPIGTKKDAALRIGKNIKSFSKSIDPTNVVTRLIPLGPAEESAAGQSQRLTIVEDSRSGGKNYIDIPELQKIYGIQNGIEIFEDEYTPDTLYNAAKRKVDDIKKNLVKQQMQINLLDLSYIGIDPDEYERGHQYEVFFEPFDVKEWMRIISTNEDITNPHNKSVVIGEKPLSIDDVQKSIAEQRTKLLQRKLTESTTALNSKIGAVSNDLQNVTEGFNQSTSTLQSNIQSQQQLITGVTPGVTLSDINGFQPIKNSTLNVGMSVFRVSPPQIDYGVQIRDGFFSTTSNSPLQFDGYTVIHFQRYLKVSFSSYMSDGGSGVIEVFSYDGITTTYYNSVIVDAIGKGSQRLNELLIDLGRPTKRVLNFYFRIKSNSASSINVKTLYVGTTDY
ncbi:phage tail spike protein [Macrococcoides caseolyticum]|uniref:phage tail spike protein n=1 Tax=Macrococcoides caseolyticum TaxID=69966 RepID=UPI0024BCE812|nr:phage tail spike protein [Macrococcus caseolyticus]MDJ1088063.1 phage tail spike protein [Macrococcus caseolyticus]